VGQLTAGNLIAKVAGHAAVGCLSSLASGGPCGAGAMAAAVSAAGTPFVNAAFPHALTDPGQFIGGTTASAIVGGLGSVAAGGSFANGAVTAAYGYLYNGLAGTWLGGGAGQAVGTAVAPWTGPFAPLVIAGGRFLGGLAGSAIEDWLFSEEVTDIPGSKPPFEGEPGSTVRGQTQTRRYGDDGFPLVDRDTGHPDEGPPGCGDHCQDWGRPPGGGKPTHLDRGPPRLPVPGDPPPPRGPGVPPPY
jgi:hypothetical protein